MGESAILFRVCSATSSSCSARLSGLYEVQLSKRKSNPFSGCTAGRKHAGSRTFGMGEETL